MIVRIATIAANAYREAVRARVLVGIFVVGLASAFYSVFVAATSLHQEARVVADLGSGSISLLAVLVAIVIGATSLHREIELKTLFPILTRPLPRHEYFLGKYLGSLLTLAVFVAADSGIVLSLLAAESGRSIPLLLGTLASLGALLGIALYYFRLVRVFVFIPWSLLLAATAWFLAAPAGAERQLVFAQAILTLGEVAIVAALATFFASFSSPFLVAVFTTGFWILGRSADTLANLPLKIFGGGIREAGRLLARICPNLQEYVPPRPVLLGLAAEAPLGSLLLLASVHALVYAAVLLSLGALVFRKRDFT